MPLAVNDIIQTTVEGRKDGQTVLNVFYHRVATPASTGTEASNITDFLNHVWAVDTGTLEPLFLNCLPTDYNLRLVRGQKVSPLRGAYVELLVVDNGEVVDAPLPTANVSWVFVKQTELAGRRGRGTTHMLMPSATWFTGGELSDTGPATRLALANAIANVQTVALGGVYEPVLFHPGFSPAWSRITHCTIKQQVRVMRRRTVGQGI